MSAKPRLARKSLAEGSASLVLREMKIEGLRVDPADLATRKGILVQAKPDTAAGVSGMLVKAGDQFGIMYATNIPSKGFQKFSIAHELGHYCIDGHSDALLANGVHYSQAGFRSSDPFELEADYFAAIDVEADLVDGQDGAEIFGDSIQFDHGSILSGNTPTVSHTPIKRREFAALGKADETIYL